MARSGGRRSLPTTAIIALILLLLCGIFIVVSPSFLRLMHAADAGSQLSKGQQILSGLHPWVQVDSSVYGPAIFYLSALAQKLSGGRLLGEIVVIFLGHFVSYLLLLRAFADRSGRGALLMLFGLLAVVAFPKFHKYHVLLPQAVFLYGLHRADRVKEPAGAAARLAIACVVAGLFRIDFGAYCVLSAALFLVLRYAPSGLGAVGQGTAALLGLGLLLVSPWLAFLASAGSLGDIVVTSYDTGRGVIAGLNKSLPAYQLGQSPLDPGNSLVLLWWFFRLAPVVVLITILFRMLRRSDDRGVRLRRLDPNERYLLPAAVFALLVYEQASHRMDISHVKQSLPAGLFVLFLCLALWWPRLSAMKPSGQAASFAGVGLLVVFLGNAVVHEGLIQQETYSRSGLRGKLASWLLTKAAGIEQGIADDNSRLARVLHRVRTVTKAGDAILFIPFQAQAYYFSGRHFETPHGWWNPGRFRAAGSQQRFIDAMATTKVIVDIPSFSFDRIPSRNARAYAPEIMRHIYSRYGIFEAMGRYILLGRDPELWKEHGRYATELHPSAVGPTVRHEVKGARCAPSGFEVTHVNTLPVSANGGIYAMPERAGLLLTTRACGESAGKSARCQAIGLLGQQDLFVTRAGEKPVSLRAFRHHTLINTRVLPAGTYRLARLPCTEVPRPEVSDRALDIELIGISVSIGTSRASTTSTSR